MPAISVLLDGELLATVNTSGYDVVSVDVHGLRIGEEFAELDMRGGTHPENEKSTHFVWINRRVLQPGQQIEVRFSEAGETLHRGETLEELFPDKKNTELPEGFKSREAAFAELRAEPSRRDGCTLKLRSSAGASFVGSTAPTDHGFGFSLTWNSFRPARASYSLGAYTLDELETRAPLTDFIREYVETPHVVNLQVG